MLQTCPGYEQTGDEKAWDLVIFYYASFPTWHRPSHDMDHYVDHNTLVIIPRVPLGWEPSPSLLNKWLFYTQY